MSKNFPNRFFCPTEFTLALLRGKWKTVILCFLKERPCRYADLRACLPGVSEKMLTERLKDLMQAGLIARRKAAEGGRTSVYVLTPKGRTLGALLHALYDWGRRHADEFDVEVGEPLERLREHTG